MASPAFADWFDQVVGRQDEKDVGYQQQCRCGFAGLYVGKKAQHPLGGRVAGIGQIGVHVLQTFPRW